jgi:threonylcarbamoyladenosine tRNA methylthiotransferase MtaB
VRVFLKVLGCRVNEAELEGWAGAFAGRGYSLVGGASEAELVVINTCAVTGEAGRKSRQAIYQARRANGAAKLVVTGCYAELETAGLEGVDLVVGNRDKDELVAEVERVFGGAEPDAIAGSAEADTIAGSDVIASVRDSRTRAFVKVQDGCRHRCTYCIVTVARGEERSRAPKDVVREVRRLVAGGRREVVLTGIHLGGYGEDLGTDLSTLVRAVLAETEVERLRISSLEPWNLPDGFFELWSDPRLCPHLHLPLQSGSDSVLRRMARRCSTDEFAQLVATARAAIPELTVTTDVIVGFPGETEAEWAETLAFVEATGFGDLHVFSYSPREGTAAARMKGQLAKSLKRSRSQELRSLGARLRRTHQERFVGSRQDVLWEGRSEEGSAPDRRRVFGYTRNYLRVESEVPAARTLRNRISSVRCTRVAGDRLVGELTRHPLPVV